MYAVLIFFNDSRTDYLVRGPYKSAELADRALARYRKVFKAALTFEQVRMDLAEADVS